MDLADDGTPNPSSLLGALSLHHTGPPEDTHHQQWKQQQWGTVIKFPAVFSPLPKQSKAKGREQTLWTVRESVCVSVYVCAYVCACVCVCVYFN